MMMAKATSEHTANGHITGPPDLKISIRDTRASYAVPREFRKPG
jgi:hypothetical protein